MDLSIIVPVYNVEKYLIRCLDSIFTQEFPGEFEVIAIDDASTDGSLAILMKYQKKESRLHVIVHDENKKLSVARATGMKAAAGKYIMHVDSDDWILPDSLIRLYNKIMGIDADIIVFNYMHHTNSGQNYEVKNITENIITNNKEEVQKYFYGACVNKIVKRTLINDMIYGQTGINNGEDLLYSTEILLKANKIALIDDVIYVYFQNNASLTNTAKINSILKTIQEVTCELSKLLLIYTSSDLFKDNIYNLMFNYFLYYLGNNYFQIDKKQLIISRIIHEIENFPNQNKIKINLQRLSYDPFYYVSQIVICRIKITEGLRFLRSLAYYLIREIGNNSEDTLVE